MADESEMLRFRPAHPGEVLREDILPALNMSVKDFATHIGVSRNTASRLLNEKAAVSTEMAIRLGQAFRNGARFWLALQLQHDLWEEESRSQVHVDPLDWPEPEEFEAA